MSYANENKENCIFFITCNESHLLNFFFTKSNFSTTKNQIEREQYPVRKRDQLSSE